LVLMFAWSEDQFLRVDGFNLLFCGRPFLLNLQRAVVFVPDATYPNFETLPHSFPTTCSFLKTVILIGIEYKNNFSKRFLSIFVCWFVSCCKLINNFNW